MMGIQRAVTSFLTIVLVVAIVGAVILIQDARREYRFMKEREARLSLRIIEAEERLAQRRVFLEKLNSDPLFLERIVREQLRLSRPGEIIFLFPEEPEGEG